ncbi:GNAT family N-acetyltransferase [Clostridium manihotivorum]|uniref:GNAT family N-acetyltransferase n=1 Tax=Clostridium manihotivorum TaxID=2320868 RepID=A0A3R5QVM8_9CLOT|nr:GNAT family N-acetyltransferase [Clostridium manihotivorum]QAA33686.1 GNAT family N-acetyltransferase [Clostridium manihotivorum]
MRTPVLETERLGLRPFCIDDAKQVFECWESDKDVAKYMFWESHEDINKTVAWVKTELSKVESNEWYRWAVTLKESGELVGTALIYLEEEYGKFEIAYNFGKSFWGHGYATETMNKVISFIKEQLDIKEIMGRHAKENPASGKVLEKLGFEYIRDIPYECNRGKNLYQGKEYILRL